MSEVRVLRREFRVSKQACPKHLDDLRSYVRYETHAARRTEREAPPSATPALGLSRGRAGGRCGAAAILGGGMLLSTVLAALAFSDFHFLAIADWGGLPFWPWASPGQRKVAEAMGELAARHESEFVLSLGDHFYFKGVRSANDARWRRSFERVYDHPALARPGFWKVCAGNHDHDGNVSAQLAYAAKPSSRWSFPGLQHAWRSTVADEAGTTIDFVLLDTQLLCGQPNGMPLPSMSNNATLLDAVTEDEEHQATEAHWAWAEAAIRNSDADYLVVGGHYPIHSPSGHGPTQCLKARLEPLLHAVRATLYLSGHDHALFHVGAPSRIQHAVQYHGVGAGLVTSSSKRHACTIRPARHLRFHATGESKLANLAQGGFAGVSASATGMTVSHYDSAGKLLHSHTAPPRSRSRESGMAGPSCNSAAGDRQKRT